MTNKLETQVWDRLYEKGRYPKDEPPVDFVQDIIDDLREEGKKKFGIYIGCGNGRNLIPLLDAGLDLRGIDISPVGIGQLIARRPEAEKRVWVSSFANLTSARVFDYVVAIQVFQHGNQIESHDNFRIAHDVLKPDGKLFLRVNSISTNIKYRHKIVDRNNLGGFSVLYQEGEKEGSNIHFYSEDELRHLAFKNGFDILGEPYDHIEPRHEHVEGVWAQWETIWRKKQN